MVGVAQCHGADAVFAGECNRALRHRMRGEVAGALVAGPALQRAEPGHALRFGCGHHSPESHHLGEARQACDTVGADAVAVGLGDQAGAERRAISRQPQRDEDTLDTRPKLIEGNANHVRDMDAVVSADAHLSCEWARPLRNGDTVAP